MLIEQDRAHILSGVRHGYTLGSPIGMTLENKDWVNWQSAMAVEAVEDPDADGRGKRITRLRPGHADLAGAMKYGFDDVTQRFGAGQRPGDRRQGCRRSSGGAVSPGVRHSSPQPRNLHRGRGGAAGRGD